jgi:hypothetical protein
MTAMIQPARITMNFSIMMMAVDGRAESWRRPLY